MFFYGRMMYCSMYGGTRSLVLDGVYNGGGERAVLLQKVMVYGCRC